MSDIGSNARLTGGQIVARTLRAHGVGTVFSLAGTTHTDVLDPLDQDGFAIVPGRSENGTVGAADGYARVTGKCGVALIIADQGVPNAMAAIASAYHACSPVIVLVGWYAGPQGTEADYEIDNNTLPMVGSVCKWAKSIPSVDRVSEYVNTALRRAMSGRRGPVILQMPSALMGAAIDAAESIDSPATVPARPAANCDAIEKAADLIAGAKQPLILAGGGAHASQAGEAIRTFVDRFNIPILGNSQGRALVPEDGARSFNFGLGGMACAQADVILVLGARLKGRLGYGLAPAYNADAAFIQVDIEPEELGRNRHINVPITADVRIAVEQLTAELDARGFDGLRGEPWTKALFRERIAYIDTVGRGENDSLVHPYRIGHEIDKRLPKDAILVQDGAQILGSIYATVKLQRGPVLDHYSLGSMGIGTPLMVGACAGAREIAKLTGAPERRVVMITGDGAFGYFSNEIGSARAMGLNPVIIVANDSAWGVEWAGHLDKLGRPINTELNPTRFDLIAEAHGCLGIRVEKGADLGPAIDKALAADVPAVIDVIIDRDATLAIRADAKLRHIVGQPLRTMLAATYGANAAK
jgi:acetolactate synthase-1/2/3 large subunit